MGVGLTHDATRNLAMCLGLLALGFLLAGGSVAGRAMPFSVCLIAVAGGPLRAMAAMLGSSVGCLSFGGVLGGLEYLAVGVLVFAGVAIAGGAALKQIPWFLPALPASMSLLVGLLFLVQARFAASAVVWYVLRLAIAAGTTRAFDKAMEGHDGCRLYALGCLICGASAASLVGGVTLGQILAVTAGAAFASAPQGLLLCAVGGLAVELGAMGPGSMTALLCFAGLVGRWIGWKLRAARAVTFLTAVTAGVLFTGGQMPELVPATALGCCLSLAVPETLIPDVGAADAARRRLNQAADVLGEIRQVLAAKQPAAAGGQVATVFDRASDKVCSRCVLWNQCWRQKSNDTYRALCAVARPMLERGAVTRDDFPHGFSETCCHLDSLTAAINRELDELAGRRQYESRLKESRAVLAGQYGFLDQYLRRMAEELEEPHLPPVSFAPELGVSAAGKPGHSISGDRGACFRTESGMYYILLCDGMGTGAEAAGESRGAVRTVAGLIRAGLEPREALETLNGIYILRGDGGFSTVDLLALSLVTGEGVLYKWGAAPSYLKSGPETKKIGTAAPPPGLGIGEGHKAEEYRLSLREGEMLVLLSDGAGGEDAGRQVAAWKDGDPKALAAAIISKAQTDGEDDMTAVALRLRPCSVLV